MLKLRSQNICRLQTNPDRTTAVIAVPTAKRATRKETPFRHRDVFLLSECNACIHRFVKINKMTVMHVPASMSNAACTSLWLSEKPINVLKQKNEQQKNNGNHSKKEHTQVALLNFEKKKENNKTATTTTLPF